MTDQTPDLQATIASLEGIAWAFPLSTLEEALRDAITLLEASRDDKAQVVALTEAIEKVREAQADLHASNRSEWVRDLQMTVQGISYASFSMALSKLDSALATVKGGE